MKGNFACSHCDYGDINTDLIDHLKAIERAVGFELIINSGARCVKCNKAEGGADNSAHVVSVAHPKCNGADISVADSRQRYFIVKAALMRGFNRIGIGKGFIHLDIDKDNPQEVVWHYYP